MKRQLLNLMRVLQGPVEFAAQSGHILAKRV